MENKKEYLQHLLIRLEDRSLRSGEKLPERVKFSSALTVGHEARQ